MLDKSLKNSIIDYIPISAFDMNNVAQKESIFNSNNKNKMSKINWHNIRMYTLIVVLFAVGGLSALQGSKIGDVSGIISVLVFLEHLLEGNSAPTV